MSFGNYTFDKPVYETEFKSAWRLEFERRSAEDRAKAKLQFKKVVQKVVQKAKSAPKKYVKKYIPRPKGPEKFCSSCAAPIKSHNTSGRCQKHQRLPRTLPCKVDGCKGMVRKKNRYGACVPHWKAIHKLELTGPANFCQHSGCLEQLTRKNKSGLCRWHGPWAKPGRLMGTQPKMRLAA